MISLSTFEIFSDFESDGIISLHLPCRNSAMYGCRFLFLRVRSGIPVG